MTGEGTGQQHCQRHQHGETELDQPLVVDRHLPRDQRRNVFHGLLGVVPGLHNPLARLGARGDVSDRSLARGNSAAEACHEQREQPSEARHSLARYGLLRGRTRAPVDGSVTGIGRPREHTDRNRGRE